MATSIYGEDHGYKTEIAKHSNTVRLILEILDISYNVKQKGFCFFKIQPIEFFISGIVISRIVL